MCGVCGQISFGGHPADVESVVKMVDVLAERDPDTTGLRVHDGNVLGHRRLKIIDLSECAHQPLVDNMLVFSIFIHPESADIQPG
jgi:asparagine synthase (glutamine-hydrolysing)